MFTRPICGSKATFFGHMECRLIFHKFNGVTDVLCAVNTLFTKVSKNYRSSRPVAFCKNVFLKLLQNSQEDTSAGVSS